MTNEKIAQNTFFLWGVGAGVVNMHIKNFSCVNEGTVMVPVCIRSKGPMHPNHIFLETVPAIQMETCLRRPEHIFIHVTLFVILC